MGSVILGERSGIWPGAIVRGDFATIRIGSGTIIEDNVVVHTGQDLEIGNNVIVGHGAVIHAFWIVPLTIRTWFAPSCLRDAAVSVCGKPKELNRVR